MTISAEFAYSGDNKEFQFRDSFVMPLLVRLGFSVVVNYHGKREFGRDVIFADIDRFGHVVYYGKQIKYESSISQSESHALIEDAVEAMTHPFTHPQTGQEEFISCFYVANAGAISSNARENFFTILKNKHGTRNAKLLDGNDLLLLDKIAFMTRGALVRERLSGLVREIGTNRAIAMALLEAMRKHVQEDGPYPVQRLRRSATESYLTAPIHVPTLLPENVDRYWQFISMANHVADSLGASITGGDYRVTRFQGLAQIIPQSITYGSVIESALSAFLKELTPPNV
jgi:hypothetical protein